MALPGKLTIGFLQEDNPQKFYFRVRPLIVQEEQGYSQIEDVRKAYAEDGFIRIVPDKNELNHFKARMRSLGRYCLIDLRRHVNENDKIRPNKNHAGEAGDRNAFIVYSDVICTAGALAMAEVIPAGQAAPAIPRPGTPFLFLLSGEQLEGPYRWEMIDAQEAKLVQDPENEVRTIQRGDENVHLFDMELENGQRVMLLVGLAALGVRDALADAPQGALDTERAAQLAGPERPAAARTAQQARPQQAATPQAAPQQPAPQPPQQRAAQPDAPEAQARPLAPKAGNIPATLTQRMRQQLKPAPQPAPEQPSGSADKPWLERTTFVFPRMLAPKLNGRDGALQAQSGINPKRGTSIKEIVDELWRQSRYDQLGHPVPAGATGSPVKSPVEQAIEALKQAWAIEEAREGLVRGILGDEELRGALGADGQPNAEDRARIRRVDERLNQLEADRLALIAEIDALTAKKQEKREALLGELRAANRAELERLEQRNLELSRAQAQRESEAEAAYRIAEIAREGAERMREGLDEQMTDQLLKGRARDLLSGALSRGSGVGRVPATYRPSAGELLSDVRVRFGEAGFELSNDQAVNLLAIFVLSRVVVVSGPVGSGKSLWARALAAALGLNQPNASRMFEIRAQADWRALGDLISEPAPTGVPLSRLPALRELLGGLQERTPAVLLIDDANLAPIDRYAGELLELGEPGAPARLTTRAEQLCLSDSLRVLMTVQDAGEALSMRLLDRAFLVRLAPEAGQWPPKSINLPTPEAAVDWDALRALFAGAAEPPREACERMRRLLAKLSQLGVQVSRRTLLATDQYLRAVAPLMQCAPLETLDYALSQRLLPSLLAGANLDVLHELSNLLADMPACLHLLGQPLPLPPM